MKILAVDDNEAVQDIIFDIATGLGHEVRVVGSIEAAIEEIGESVPDIIILDSVVGGQEGVGLISEARERFPDIELSVILLKNGTEPIPTDVPAIKAGIDKPFKSADIRNAISAIRSSGTEVTEKKRRGRFGKRRKQTPPPDTEPEEHGVFFGEHYVVFESEPDKIYEFLRLFDLSVYDAVVVTVGRAKAIRERVSYQSVDVIKLGVGLDTTAIGEMGTLASKINEFVESHDKPLVVFDTFTEILEKAGTNRPLLMLRQLSNRPKAFTMAVSVDGEKLTEKDRAIFLYGMKEFGGSGNED